MLYSKGDAVVCNGTGVCTITDIRKERFGSDVQTYYLLLPVYENCPTKIYIPVANEKTRLRSLITKEEIFSILDSVKETQSVWNDDDKMREKDFHDIIKSGDYTKIIKMISEIHQYQQMKKNNGGKLRQTDENAMKEAEKTVSNEFAYVLDITPQEVKHFIIHKIEN